MVKPYLLFVLGVGFFLSGCDAWFGRGDKSVAALPAPLGGASGVDSGCGGIVFETVALERAGFSLPFVVEGLVVQAASVETTCQSLVTENDVTREVLHRGYSRLQVSGGFSAAGSVEERLQGEPKRAVLEIRLVDETVSIARLQQLLNRLKITTPLPIEKIFTTLSYRQLGLQSFVVVDGLDVVRAEIEIAPSVGGQANSVLRIEGPREKQIFEKLTAGSSFELVSVADAASTTFSFPQALGLTIRPGEPVLALGVLPQDIVLSQIWTDHARTDDAKIEALWLARLWVARQTLQVADFDGTFPGLEGLFNFAKGRWNLEPTRVNRMDVAALRFLTTLGDFGSAALTMRLNFAATWSERLQEFFPTSAETALAAAVRWSRDGRKLTPWQREYTLGLAKVLKSIHRSDPWVAAQILAPKLDYDVKRRELLQPTYRWLQSEAGPSLKEHPLAVAKSEAYVLRKHMSEGEFSELQKTFSEQPKNVSKREALERSEKIQFGAR